MDETAPPPVPTPGEKPRRLTRHPTDRVIAGVAGGLGHYLGVDSVVVRIVFVALAVLGGGGIVLYLIAWLLMPEGEDLPAPAAVSRDPSRWIGVGLVALGLLLLGGQFLSWRPGVLWALILLAAGVLLLRRSASEGDAERPVPVSDAEPPTPEAAPPPSRGPDSDRVPERGPGQLFVGLLATVLSALWLADELGGLAPSVVHYVAAALAVVGIVLVVSAWRGRARWLIPLGIALLPVALAASIVRDVPFGGAWGERDIRPPDAVALEPVYRLGAGTLRLDLSAVRPAAGRRADVEVTVGMGELRVVAPAGVRVSARGTVTAGEVRLLDRSAEGLGPSLEVTQAGDERWGRLVLDLRAGLGTVVLEAGS